MMTANVSCIQQTPKTKSIKSSNEYNKGTDISMYRPLNRAIHHCDLINISILFALCELFFLILFFFFKCVFVSRSFFLSFCICMQKQKHKDCLNLFFWDVLRWNILYCCCCCSLQFDSTQNSNTQKKNNWWTSTILTCKCN